MMESYLRPAFQGFFVDPIVRKIERHTQLTPMTLTYAAGFMGVLCGVFLWLGYVDVACLMLLFSGYLDVLDGSLARHQQISSPKGAVLDIVMDRIVEFSVMLGLLSVAPAVRAYPVMWMLGSSLICVTSFLVVGVFSENGSHKSFHYSVGLMERAEAFLFFILMMLRPSWFILLAWTYTILVLGTAMIRVYQFQKIRISEKRIE